MTVNLNTTYAGVALKNPLVVGAGPNTATPRACERAAKAGWAAVVLKGNTADDIIEKVYVEPQAVFKVPRPAYKILDARGIRKWRPTIRTVGSRQSDYQLAYYSQNTDSPYTLYSGIGNYFNGTERYRWYIDETKKLVEPYGCKVVANITAYTLKGWEQQIDVVNKSRADVVELVMAPPAYGCFDPRSQKVVRAEYLDIFPRIVEDATRFCVERSDKPVAVKLPPYFPDYLAPVKSAERAGARAIHFGDCPSITSPIPAIVVDPDTLEVGLFPGMPYGSALTQCSAIPYICGAVAKFRLEGIELDIAGCGGVRNHLDVVRLLMCGANIVEIVTAVLVEGVDIGRDFFLNLVRWMEQKGFLNLSDFRGILATPQRLSVKPKDFVYGVARAAGGPSPCQRIELTEKRCIHCGWCESTCPEVAIKMRENLPIIDDELCEICGLCVSICPTQALTISAIRG